MIRTINASLVILALGVGLAACDRIDDTRRSDGPGRLAGEKNPGSTAPVGSPTEPRAVQLSDSDLEEAVKAKLRTEEQLRTADLDVDANADKNEVTISGTVQSQEQRDKAIQLAKSAGVTVNDKIDVKPAS
ncbi:MAG TPA: BON domain-containing protein [Candidatus Binatia bacterium]|nr:BON domain-containing protein [Candidatus Binatia bacterium]